MHDFTDYELLDFAAGRKLERFGQAILDRPSPAAAGARPAADPRPWNFAHARYELSPENSSQRGRWNLLAKIPDRWQIVHGPLRFELKLTDFGHVGLFPEQVENWSWLADRIAARPSPESDIPSPESDPPRVLNLFAYTGAATLAAASAGAHVTHVDASRAAVAWARRNAELSSLVDAPIRWIAEDVIKFCRRELRRDRRYQALILDPPSYGHGPAGEPWKLEENLPELLSICRDLIESPRFILLTAHSPQHDGTRLKQCLIDANLAGARDIHSGNLYLTTATGRSLHAGSFARSPF